MVPKDTKGPYSARRKPAEAGPSVVTPLDMIDGPSTFVHGAGLGSMGDSMFNPILIPSDEPGLEIAPANYNAVSSSSSTEKEDTSPRKRSKRAREEDDSEDRVTILGVKINKQRKLNASKTVSPKDPSDARHIGSNIGSQVLYPFGFEAPVNSEPSMGNPVVNDPSSSRLVDNDKSQTNSIILPDWIEAIDCKSAEFAAAELNAGDYFLDAFIALIEYTHTLDDAKSSLELVREARHEMAEAWGLWRTVAMAHVNLSVLQHYGSMLDGEGKRALAAALKVESDQLEGWFDEPRRVANPTLEVEEPSPGPLSQDTEPPCYTHGPPSLFFTPISGPPPAGLYSNPLTTVAISSAPTPKRSRNVNRNCNLPPLLAALASSVAAIATTSTAQEITFGKTPAARIIPQKGHQPGDSSGDLPRWAKGFDYCDSYADLVQWIQSRHTHFARPISSSFSPFQGMTTEEEGQVVDELTDGKGLAHTFTRDESRQLERRAYAVLPPEQLPLLLDGDVATRAYRGSEEAPPFTLVCRANFYVDWEKGISYRDRICGTTFRTDESAIRHIRERHLTVNRPRASKAKKSTKKKHEDDEDEDAE
ncbi:hypothetical protein FRC17_010092 [Serendipita sp. 399]|nr:hypothetical protein FRC17_010092 [Serendipita sp. 399]